MKLKIIGNEKNELRAVVDGVDHSFLAILIEEVLDMDNVESASYKLGQTTGGSAEIYIKTKSGSPQAALKTALGNAKKNIKGISK